MADLDIVKGVDNVIYVGWGERFQLGVLADDFRQLLFEYSPQALKRGLELSPFKLALGTNSFGDFPGHQHRLPGLVSDALPDGWGMFLMDRLFRKQGRDLAQFSPLDRLAFIGDRAMGALVFEPADTELLTPADVELLDLARDVRDVVGENSEGLLRKLMLMGGSPHGARPKVLVNFDRKNNRMSNAENAAGTPLLVKFPAQHEHKEVYTAAGAAHVDHRIPQLDYVAFLRLTRFMTRDAREVLQAFERCVFNVVFNNRDDHSKNISFLMGEDGRWKLSPAYDLTFNEGPNGEHQMDICGEARAPDRKHLLQLASKAGIVERTAADSIERISTTGERFSDFVGDLPIRVETMELMEKAVKSNRARLI